MNQSNNTERRQFLKAVGVTGMGLAGLNLAACGSPGADAVTGANGSVTVTTAKGVYTYDPGLFQLALNLGAFASFADEIHLIKIRALLDDAMYWKVEIGDETLLQQWTRISAVEKSTQSTIVGTWVNHVGQALTFAEDGSVTHAYAEESVDDYGYLGEQALVASIFRQSVAAGDPSTDGFIIWTRAVAAGNVPLNWEVATDHLFTDVVSSGSTVAVGAIDHTVKVTLTGLQAGQTYFYRFYTDSFLDAAGNRQFSHTGRAKTLPVGSPDNLKFALLSCSSHPHGYFNAYRQVARQDDLDGCFHLGDYTYEYPGDPSENPENDHDYKDDDVVANGRVYRYGNIRETVELEDYRLRFRNYREDIDLQLLHTRYSFINTWDDHETTNDSYDPDGSGPEGDAENHNDIPELDEGEWEPRKAAAAQAYNEWLPITDVRSKGEGTYNDPRLDRKFLYGDLIELVIIDTRVAGRKAPPNSSSADYDDPSQAFMSDAQRTLVHDTLANSTATWKVLGQQTMMGHLIGPPIISQHSPGPDERWACVINTDQWDGFAAEREAIFQVIEDNNVDNFVCLTGDIHTSWAIDLVDEPRDRLEPLPSCVGANLNPAAFASNRNYGVEFVTPSITSPGLADPGSVLSTGLTTNNPHLHDVDLENRGYSIMEVTPAKTTCTWYHVASITDPENEEQSVWRVYSTAEGSNQLTNETPA